MKKKEEIFHNALKLFIEFGYGGTPISRIANEVGLTKAGFYHYFRTKEDLLFELHEWHVKKELVPIIEKGDKISDPLERLEYSIKEYTKLLAKDPAPKVLINEINKISAHRRKDLLKYWQKAFNVIRDCILKLDKAGKIDDVNPTFASFAAVGMVSWILYWFDYSRTESYKEVGDLFTKIFLEGILKRKDK